MALAQVAFRRDFGPRRNVHHPNLVCRPGRIRERLTLFVLHRRQNHLRAQSRSESGCEQSHQRAAIGQELIEHESPPQVFSRWVTLARHVICITARQTPHSHTYAADEPGGGQDWVVCENPAFATVNLAARNRRDELSLPAVPRLARF